MKIHQAFRFTILLVLFFLFTSSTAIAVDVPYLQGRVTDDAEILSAPAKERIGEILKQHEDKTSDQIAVLTVPTLEGESVESYAQDVFDTWKLGQKGKDNGILVLIAPEERRMRIHVGYGLEGDLTDGACGRIIRNVITPHFKSNDFDAGIEQGVQAIIGQLEGTGTLPSEQTATESSSEFFETSDIGIIPRILMGCFIFGIIGLFTGIGVLTPGMGWFLYFFLIPFWATFPIIIIGSNATIVVLAIYLIGFPVTKIILSRTEWYKKAKLDLKTKGTARIGGFTIGGRSGGSSSHSWSSSSSFSGGGGSSGGGGASGSW